MQFYTMVRDIASEVIAEGGAGSGNYGHKGRPGKRGGSMPGGGKGVSSVSVDRTIIPGKGAPATPTELNRLKLGVPEEVKQRMQQSPLERLRFPEKVDSPEEGISRSSDPVEKRMGKCYEYAGKFVMNNPTWTLVHATLYPQAGGFEDQPYFHAFATKKDVVYEAVFDKFHKKDDYFKYYSITDVREYPMTEMSKKVWKHRHWGSWD